MVANIHIGCCGFPMARKKYYQEFNVVEIQQTFYEPPRATTAEKWRAEAPEEFEFTIKAWQVITHPPSSPTYRRLKTPLTETQKRECGFFKPTEVVFQAWSRTEEFARALNAKIILFQCPARFTPTQENINNIYAFFSRIERDDFIFVWEPRGDAWEQKMIKKICRDLELIHCVDPFKAEPLFGKINYFRLHGITGYRYDYTDSELKTLLKKLNPSRSNYIMFNNSEMLADARQLKDLLKA